MTAKPRTEVEKIRSEMGLDRQSFGKLFGVHRTTINRYENRTAEPSEAMLRWMRDELTKYREAA